MLDNRIRVNEARLDEIEGDITHLMNEANEVVRRAAAAGPQVTAVPAQQQINQLLLLDAIRDIAR